MATWSSLTKDDCPFYTRFVSQEAKALAQRLTNTLAPLFAAGTKGKAVPKFERWGQPVKDWKERFVLIEEIFSGCLALRARCPLKQCYFEAYMPASGTAFDSATMVVDESRAREASPSDSVLFCTMPAVITYPTREWQKAESEIIAISGFGEFMVRKDGERDDGTVMSKASVILQ